MKFFANNKFFLDKKIIVTLYDLFFSTNISSNQYQNLRTETVTIKKYSNTIRLVLNLDETISFRFQDTDESISIKY